MHACRNKIETAEEYDNENKGRKIEFSLYQLFEEDGGFIH